MAYNNSTGRNPDGSREIADLEALKKLSRRLLLQTSNKFCDAEHLRQKAQLKYSLFSVQTCKKDTTALWSPHVKLKKKKKVLQ